MPVNLPPLLLCGKFLLLISDNEDVYYVSLGQLTCNQNLMHPRMVHSETSGKSDRTQQRRSLLKNDAYSFHQIRRKQESSIILLLPEISDVAFTTSVPIPSKGRKSHVDCKGLECAFAAYHVYDITQCSLVV